MLKSSNHSQSTLPLIILIASQINMLKFDTLININSLWKAKNYRKWNYYLRSPNKPIDHLQVSKKGIQGIFCVRLLMDMTAFLGQIFTSRIIFGNHFPSRFQIWGRNFKFPTFRVRKSWKTLLFRRLINCVWLLMDMSAFPGPIFKRRTIFRNDFSSQF